MHPMISPLTAHTRLDARWCLQGLALLAADRDLRTVIEQRSGTLMAKSSAGEADSSLFTSDGTVDVGQSATTWQASEEAEQLGGVSPLASDVIEAQPLQSLPTGTTLGSLKGARWRLLRPTCLQPVEVDISQHHFSRGLEEYLRTLNMQLTDFAPATLQLGCPRWPRPVPRQ